MRTRNKLVPFFTFLLSPGFIFEFVLLPTKSACQALEQACFVMIFVAWASRRDLTDPGLLEIIAAGKNKHQAKNPPRAHLFGSKNLPLPSGCPVQSVASRADTQLLQNPVSRCSILARKAKNLWNQACQHLLMRRCASRTSNKLLH